MWSRHPLLRLLLSPHQLQRSVAVGLKTLWLHKLRSLLTALGIVFGVASVIAMLAIGEGASEEAQKQIERLGSRNIIIQSVKPTESENRAASSTSFVLEYGVTTKDLGLLEDLPSVAISVPARIAADAMEYHRRKYDGEVVGTKPEYLRLKSRRIRPGGRFLTDHDMENHSPVAVLTAATAAALFPAEDPVGLTMKVQESRYTIVGILEDDAEPGQAAGVTGAFRAYIPLTAMTDRYGETLFKRKSGSFEAEKVAFHEVTLQAGDITQIPALAAAVRQVFRTTHQANDYQITVPVELMRQAEQTKRIFNIVLGSIAAISLVVGGIGIMNIMLASVTERTREIGIRRALGARRVDIILQFLIETVILSGIGGIIGVFLGMLLPMIITHFADMKAIIRLWAPTTAFTISVLTGIIFGIYPALRAARMSPVEALRHE